MGRVFPSHFSSCPSSDLSIGLPGHIGHFSYSPFGGKRWPKKKFEKLFETALEQAGDIDVVLFPELAFGSTDEYDEMVASVTQILRRRLKGKSPPASVLILAGMVYRDDSKNIKEVENVVLSTAALCPSRRSEWIIETMKQSKHHSWKLNSPQITQYGLGKQLDFSRQ